MSKNIIICFANLEGNPSYGRVIHKVIMLVHPCFTPQTSISLLEVVYPQSQQIFPKQGLLKSCIYCTWFTHDLKDFINSLLEAMKVHHWNLKLRIKLLNNLFIVGAKHHQKVILIQISSEKSFFLSKMSRQILPILKVFLGGGECVY